MLANPQQNAKVGAHLWQKRRIGPGVEGGFAGGPVQALEVVHQLRTIDLVNGCRLEMESAYEAVFGASARRRGRITAKVVP